MKVNKKALICAGINLSLFPQVALAVNSFHKEEERKVRMGKSILKFNKKDDLENLKRPSVEVTAFDDQLAMWAQYLIDTTKFNRCYGVAAPQIGINIRMICINCIEGKDPFILINPVIINASGTTKFEERCLSFPGLAVRTKRKTLVQIKYQDINGADHDYMAEGIEAICIQHEVEHLDGILLSDKGPLYKAK